MWDIFTSVNSFFDTFSQQDQCFCILISFQVSNKALSAVKCTTDIPFFFLSLFFGAKGFVAYLLQIRKYFRGTIHSEDGLDFFFFFSKSFQCVGVLPSGIHFADHFTACLPSITHRQQNEMLTLLKFTADRLTYCRTFHRKLC